MNTHQNNSDLGTLWGQIMIEPKTTACRADDMATRLIEYGTDVNDTSAVIMRLIHSGFHSTTIARDMDKAIRRVADFKRSAAAAFDAHFPITTNRTGASQ